MLAANIDNRTPLCVDLDGTILATDVLWEAILVLLKTRPLSVLLLPLWVLKGKAFFKRKLMERVAINPAHLPYREEVLSFLRGERRAGREIILTTASDEKAATNIANHLGVFSGILASNGIINLSGTQKLKAIVEKVGGRGFDYMGNGTTDILLCQAANQAILVDPSFRLRTQAQRNSSVHSIISSHTNSFVEVIKALRLHQWTKNVLVFVPVILAHKAADLETLLLAVYAFLAFGLCASSVYVINDLLDLDSDRQDPFKRNRPFASGTVQIRSGLFFVPVLLGSSLLIGGLFLPPLFNAAIGLYFVLNTAYSLYLKRLPIVDVLVLAGSYTIRVVSGGIAVSVPISPWLLAFSVFFFVSLAFMKRFGELRLMRELKRKQSNGRGYVVDDMEFLTSVGPASGYLSVLVLALYINSDEVTTLYQHPAALWLIGIVLLYWISRMWFLAHRGAMDYDPIVFAIKDPVSYAVGAVLGIVMVAASL